MSSSSSKPRRRPDQSSPEQEFASPSSTVTTASNTSNMSSSTCTSEKSTRSQRSRDNKASESMKDLTLKTLEDVNFCNADFTNGGHLLHLISKKVEMTTKEKEEFMEADLKDQLKAAIMNHTPSDCKMIYMRVQITIFEPPDPDFFKSPVKGRANLIEIIWEHRVLLKTFWNG